MTGLTPADLRPGDLAFGPIGGAAGALVAAGQMIVAPWKHQLTWRRWWKIRHTGVITSASQGLPPGSTWKGQVYETGVITAPTLVQAEPGGVEEIEMRTSTHWTKEWVYIRPWYQPGQAERVAAIARRQAAKKIPYAFECYPAILAHRTYLPIPHVDDWLARTDADGDPVRVICSWEVDTALTLAGFEVFSDGRVPHDVVPSELYLRLLELGPELVTVPGVASVTSSLPGYQLHLRQSNQPATSKLLL